VGGSPDLLMVPGPAGKFPGTPLAAAGDWRRPCVVPVIVITKRSVRQAIISAIEQLPSSWTKEPIHVDAIAATLGCSRPTLQRRLRELATCFTHELTLMQAALAAEAILRGASTVDAAARAGVSPDHLRHILREHCGIGPAGLIRCRTIAARLDAWTKRPAAAHTKLYRKRLGQWAAYQAELHRHLDPIPAESFLRKWADPLIARSRRPDFRRGPSRRYSREQRARDRAEVDVMVREFLDDAATRFGELRVQDLRPLRSDHEHEREQPPISAPAAEFKT